MKSRSTTKLTSGLPYQHFTSVAILGLLLSLLSVSVPETAFAQPTSLVVDTNVDEADDGECDTDCTLREALGLIASGGTITFNATLDGETIALTQGDLQITRPLTVDASGLPGGLTVDAQQNSQVFVVTDGAASGEGAILIGLTITGGYGEFTGGGGIYNRGTLTLRAVTVSGNSNAAGGGINSSKGALTLQKTTVSGNEAAYAGGGAIWASSTVLIENSTVAGNTGGGLYMYGGSALLRNSVLADASGDADCITINGGSVTASHTLIEDGTCITPGVDGNLSGDPLLGPLVDNGGATLTHLPQKSSSLLGAGHETTCLDTDQRGENRPQPNGTACDIGAVEVVQFVPPTELVVDTNADEADDGECDDDCTLREALGLIASGGTITFDAGVTGTINLTAVLPGLSQDVDIHGPGADVLTIRRDTGGNYRVFDIISGATVTISGLTISNGATPGAGIRNGGELTVRTSTITGNSVPNNSGGGIYNLSSGMMNLESSTIHGNTAGMSGAGIYNAGTLTVKNSSVSDNTTSGINGFGGGIRNAFGGTMTILNSTIVSNLATTNGGGIWNDGGVLTIRNSVSANNTTEGSEGGDCVLSSGTVTATYSLIESGGCITAGEDGNLDGDPMLGDLADNGGSTLTHLPLEGSPLLGAGDETTCLDTDQRGENRPQPNGTACDIGAVEVEQFVPPTELVVDTLADEADDGECDEDCTLREALALIASGGTITFSVTGTIELNNGLPNLERDVTIEGPGADLLTVRRKNSDSKWYRIFTIPSGVTVVISGLTIANGESSTRGARNGGGIHNSGTLTLDTCTLTGNKAYFRGGAILNTHSGDLKIINSTLSGNSTIYYAGTEGGAIYNNGTLLVEQSTLSHNGGYGGAPGVDGIQQGEGATTIRNSTFLNGSSTTTTLRRDNGTVTVFNSVFVRTSGNANFSGEITSLGYNVCTDDCGLSATGDQTNTNPLLADLADNGGPTLTHLPQAGSPLIDAGDPTTLPDHFLTDDEGNPIDQAGNPRFTGAAIDIGAVETDGLSVSLTGSEGFRTLSAPVSTALADLLSPLWTQGIPGTDDSSGDANLWLWNNGYAGNDTGGWTIPSDVSTTTLNPGEGALVYVFEDDQPDTPGSWPKTLSVSGTVPDLPFSGFTINTNSGGFTLLGNPAVSNIDWDEVSRSNLDDAVYVWDPSSGADGQWLSYVNGSGDLTGGIISPFQGFMVRTNGASPSLEISQTTTAGTFYGKESAGEGPIAMRLQLDGQELTSSAWFYLTEDGSLMEDAGDALKLQPFATEYALLSTTSSDGVLLDINHLPLETDAAIHLPLNVEATRNGTFTLTITQMNLPDGWSAVLRDHQTGKEMTVNEDTEYSFKLENSAIKRKTSKVSETLEVLQSSGSLLPRVLIQPSDRSLRRQGFGGQAKRLDGSGASRFTLIIVPEGVDIQSSTLPEEFVLSQNYPNPFNPTTVISYQLPVNSEVRLEVYDMLGRNVATLVNEQVAAGRHSVNFDASGLSSGVYLYRLAAGRQIMTRKLTVVK